jgi:hypothetical protein
MGSRRLQRFERLEQVQQHRPSPVDLLPQPELPLSFEAVPRKHRSCSMSCDAWMPSAALIAEESG